MQYLPEPLNLLAVPGVVTVHSMLLPLSDVKLLHPTQHQLQLSLIKELEPVQGHHLIEPIQKGLGLLLDPSLEPPLRHQSVCVSVCVCVCVCVCV